MSDMEDMELDPAIKFGAGRYRQGKGVLAEAGEEIRRFGKKIYIVAGPRAFDAVKDRLLPGLRRAGMEYEIEIYTGVCCHEKAKACAERCKKAGCDELVGVGGGKIMDFAKAAADKAGIGVFNIPTSIATCAAFTNMSIMYTPEGAYEGNLRYDHEVDGVLVDLDVILQCPVRYTVSGIIDAMAKWVEIPNGRRTMSPEDTDYDLYTAYCMAEYTYKTLLHLGGQAVRDIRRGRASRAVEYAAFINIAVTGNIANITRSCGQSALAHTFYYGVRSCFTRETKDALHGEIVGIGLFVQLSYNGMEQAIPTLRRYMETLEAPVCMPDLGIPETVHGGTKSIDRLEQYMVDSSYVKDTEEDRGKLHRAMKWAVYYPLR